MTNIGPVPTILKALGVLAMNKAGELLNQKNR